MAGRIQSVVRAADILDILEFSDRPLQLGEIAEELELPKATVHGLVRTLVDCDFAEQDPATGGYCAGIRLGRGSLPAMDRNELRSAAMSWADSLAMAVGSEVLLAQVDGDSAVLAHHVFRPDDTTQRLRVGDRVPLHATAVGKLLLAYAQGRDRLVRSLDLTRYTAATMTTPGRLLTDLDRTRARAVAVTRGEYEPEVCSVAVHVYGLGHGARAALGVLGDDRLLTRDGAAPEVLAELRRHAGAIARALQPVR